MAFAGTPEQRCLAVQQEGSQNMQCVKRPDGTVVTDAEGTSPAIDGGSSVRSATLFTKDGYEIFVNSSNAGDGKGRPLAAEPPFSRTQLIRAVTSDIWF